MKVLDVSLASVVFCLLVFAHVGAIDKRHRIHRIERRSALEDCNIAQVEGFWNKGAKGPDAIPDMNAAVCFNTNSHSEVQDNSPEHYRLIEGDHYCRHKRDQVSLTRMTLFGVGLGVDTDTIAITLLAQTQSNFGVMADSEIWLLTRMTTGARMTQARRSLLASNGARHME
ncbi:uncharacterized protein UTRI_03104_B [Ustilago trichophora]|uniref:Uncharacterized protein n=1 Tax=Ustilago trichophora TaxID=86804 RepID=A0A5C3E450_9BASI|nr:uncharacterized protein UTRI_03104_B [Ustilago trichophora]